MAKLNLVTFLWGDKYSVRDVQKLKRGVKRNLHEDHRFICVTDREDSSGDGVTVVSLPQDALHLIHIKGCFIRLKLFDPAWQEVLGVQDGDRIVSMDLDTVITGPLPLDPLFTRPDNFLILTGANAANPNPYNGSLWMFRAGYRPDVWHDFSLEAAQQVPFHEFPDDQGWLHHKLPGVTGWKVGPESGVYAYQKPGWPKGDALPADARMVVFFGWRKPEKFKHLPWVKQHWLT